MPFLLASAGLKVIPCKRLLLSAFAKSDVPAIAASQKRCHTVHRDPMASEQQESLPRTTIAKLVREAAPGHLRVAKEVIDLVSDCCIEFVQLVTAEANQMMDAEKKQTMSPEHVLRAIQQLEFRSWQADLTSTISEFKTEAKANDLQRRDSRKAQKNCGLTEEEQMALQEQLFANARMGQMPNAPPPPVP